MKTVRENNCLLWQFVLIILIPVVTLYAQDNEGIQRIVFEEFQIEGKIRRPQLVLIKAEQRPKFTPMVMQSLDSDVNVVEYAKDPALEKSPYSGAFMFNGREISNYEP